MGVVAGAAGEAFATPDGGSARTLGQAAARVGGAEDGDDGGAGDAGEVERAGIVGDEERGGVEEGEGLGEGELTDQVGDWKRGEEGLNPRVTGAADEDDLDLLLEEEFGEGDVMLGLPAAQAVVVHHVLCAGGGDEDA